MLALDVLLAAALVALGRRTVGGVWGDDWHVWTVPHLLACIAWATSVGLAAALGGAPWWGCIAAGLGAWIGHTVKGLWDAAGMGHLPPDNRRFSWARFARDFGFMGLYGLQCSGAAAVVALRPHGAWEWVGPEPVLNWWISPGLGPLIVVLGGLSVEPIYALTWAVAERRPIGWWRGCEPPLAMGEWLWGAVLGASICLGLSL